MFRPKVYGAFSIFGSGTGRHLSLRAATIDNNGLSISCPNPSPNTTDNLFLYNLYIGSNTMYFPSELLCIDITIVPLDGSNKVGA